MAQVLSKYKPTETEIGVLAKGLNFSITTQCMPIKEIVTVTKIACKQLKQENGQPDEEAVSKLRNKMLGILQNAKPPKSNMNKAEREALKPLKENKDITILPADKGKAVVVMNREEYPSQCENIWQTKTLTKK